MDTLLPGILQPDEHNNDECVEHQMLDCGAQLATVLCAGL
jgi:hypothetical protein